jgi:NADH dehydrogenase [ubiquinone] 1 alpha subcomplex assembly factor 5
MEHLQAMGENTASLNRHYYAGKDTLLAMASIYQELYGQEDGTIVATFQVCLILNYGLILLYYH